MDVKKAREFIGEIWDKSGIPEICKYIEIPNQSPAYDKEWATNGHMDKAIDLLVNWVKSQNVPGFSLEVVRLEGRTPVIFGVLDAKDSTQNVLLYGHMDKQPPLTEAWEKGLGPYTPVIRGDRLYGRGGADDGYSTFATIIALKALIDQNLPRPRCVMLIEAREESGSGDLQAYVEHLKDRIQVPSLVVCLDSGCGTYDQFWMTTSLRGNATGVLEVKILKEGVHSGHASGVVPSSFRIIRTLLDRIEDAQTGFVKVPAFHKEIPDFRVQQVKDTAQILGDELIKEFPFVEGARPMGNDLVELMLNRTWRPTVSYTGAAGFPTLEMGGNVLRPETSIKLSFRIPPHVEPKQASRALKEILEKDPPYGAKVTYHEGSAMGGWASPALSPWLEQAITEAGLSVFGKKHAFIGEGGSIPFMGMLGEKFPQAQFVITGILGPGSNAHGPNEFLHIPMVKNVTTVVSYILHALAHQK